MALTHHQIIKMIKSVPDGGMPALLACVVKECVHRKIFKDKPLTDVVATLAHKSMGKKGAPAPKVP